jgi:hypothetical protein
MSLHVPQLRYAVATGLIFRTAQRSFVSFHKKESLLVAPLGVKPKHFSPI